MSVVAANAAEIRKGVHNLGLLADALDAAAAAAVYEVGADMSRVVKLLVSTPYPPASRPFAAPHRRSGRLRREMRARVSRVDRRGRRVVEVGSSARNPKNRFPYARYLERDGTRKMRPRPHLVVVAPMAAVKLPVRVRVHVAKSTVEARARMIP